MRDPSQRATHARRQPPLPSTFPAAERPDNPQVLSQELGNGGEPNTLRGPRTRTAQAHCLAEANNLRLPANTAHGTEDFPLQGGDKDKDAKNAKDTAAKRRHTNEKVDEARSSLSWKGSVARHRTA